MILFVPAYDPQTRSNLAIAQQLACEPPEGVCHLFGDGATRAALIDALGNRKSSVFVMSHGQQTRLVAQWGETAIDEQDEQVLTCLAGRAVFAYACHTANQLGRTAAHQGAIWWGYTGKLQCPVHEPPFGVLFSRLFQFIINRFWMAMHPLDRDSFFVELRSRSDAVACAIDDFGERYADMDTFSAQLCALHVWDRLRIWVTGADGPEHHPDARPPVLLLD
jgi:hypothetical protein